MRGGIALQGHLHRGRRTGTGIGYVHAYLRRLSGLGAQAAGRKGEGGGGRIFGRCKLTESEATE